ncbi:hypothetical protein BDN72DRAFT_864080 [Pluteus cervinus]|uniref:Uncharacterized protein n=1 Tax=Pluteus cervinus TaxID=181527 RepID=A0ACD3A4P2_9AGAR|nr:hypothetical protein BDN72DRAFT_864080 [Pluteus cervinus]
MELGKAGKNVNANLGDESSLKKIKPQFGALGSGGGHPHWYKEMSAVKRYLFLFGRRTCNDKPRPTSTLGLACRSFADVSGTSPWCLEKANVGVWCEDLVKSTVMFCAASIRSLRVEMRTVDICKHRPHSVCCGACRFDVIGIDKRYPWLYLISSLFLKKENARQKKDVNGIQVEAASGVPFSKSRLNPGHKFVASGSWVRQDESRAGYVWGR